MKEQGLFHTVQTPEATYTATLSLDLSTVEASLAGPKRPQDRVRLGEMKKNFETNVASLKGKGKQAPSGPAVGRLKNEGGGGVAVGAEESVHHHGGVKLRLGDVEHQLHDGSVVIAAITSCTNTSNPAVLFAAGLLAKKAVERGLTAKPWVKTSLAPGSKVVTEYLAKSGLDKSLEALGFFTVGYGCTTCIGNSGPLLEPVSKAIDEGNLVVSAVLSGNRNFEGRVHPEVRANYLASPPLVVAYALAGKSDIDLTTEPIGNGKDGKDVMLKDIWPTRDEIGAAMDKSVDSEMFKGVYADVFKGDAAWGSLAVPEGELYAWDDKSTYVKHPPYFVDMGKTPAPVSDITGARVLLLLGDSITTDHISPAGSIKKDGPAGKYLIAHGVEPKDFNSYGARRGNHEVMVRGTFANVRLKNLLAPGTEGGVTRHLPDGETMSVFDASVKYEADRIPLVVLAGKEYGSGSSRDWAAKGPRLLGVRAVIAESYERIHRSNLVGMGILPLQFKDGQNAASLGLTGEEAFAIEGLKALLEGGGREVSVKAAREGKPAVTFSARVRIDTPQEVLYYQHGGILQYVLRQLLG